MTQIDTTAYLAAPYRARDILKDVRDNLFIPAGIQITSRWLEQEYPIETEPDQLDQEVAYREATKDLMDVNRATHFVLFSASALGVKSNGRGGRHVEYGYAKARNKVLWLVGDRQNIFEYLIPGTHETTDAAGAVSLIKHWELNYIRETA